MTDERQARVKALFLEAADLDVEARRSFIERECGDDEALRREVESLLAHHEPQTIIRKSHAQDTLGWSRTKPATAKRSSSPRVLHRLRRIPQKIGATGQLALGGVIATLVLGGMGYWLFVEMRSSTRELWSDRLEFLLDADVTALESWLENEVSTVESWARDPRLQDPVEGLLKIDAIAPDGPKQLADSPWQTQIGETIRSIAGRDIDYVIVDRTGTTVATASEARRPLAMAASAEEAADLSSVFAGKTIVKLPFFSRADLKEGEPAATATPSMAVVTPIRDDTHTIVAALAIGGPGMFEEFNKLLSEVRTGDTGETYAFNAQGRMISESRFDEQNRNVGLIADVPGSYSALRVELRDPGTELKAGDASNAPNLAQPFTKAVADALSGRGGVDLSGYRDYRGVWVVGAWRWLPQWGFGIVTEVDYSEASAVRRYFTIAFGLLFGLLLLSVVTLLASSYRIRRLQRQVGEAMRLGPYTLEEKIGEGGMGEVYKARHALLKRPTAIKLLKTSIMSDEAVARFEREVQLASQLAHPSTIEIYDFGQTPEGVFYYAMEYLTGLTLRQLVIIEGAIPPARVIHLLRQVCGSLREAHEMGQVHRDISPNNIMLCRRGGMADVAKVLDFGLAKPIQLPDADQITGTGTLVGTPLYIAPERFRDPATADPRSDLYALGCVTYKLLTGRDVFEAATPIDLFYQIINTPPKRPADCVATEFPSALDQLVMDCLAKEPNDRPKSISAVLDQLDRIETTDRWSREDALLWWEQNETRLHDMQTIGVS